MYSPHSPKSAPASASAVQEPSDWRCAWYQREAPDGDLTSKEAFRAGSAQPDAERAMEPSSIDADTETSPAENSAEAVAASEVKPSIVAHTLTE